MQLNVKLRSQAKESLLPSRAGKVTMQGSNANVSHTINEEEKAEFTNHINSVSVYWRDVFFTAGSGRKSFSDALPRCIERRCELGHATLLVVLSRRSCVWGLESACGST